MPAPSAPTKPRSGRSTTRTTARGRIVAPILARHLRNGIEESVHRGDIVEADVNGRVLRQLGDPDRLVTLRSTVKPFGLARAHRGRRDRRLRPRAGRAGRPCQLAFGRGHARADAPGDLPPVGREPGPARLRLRGRPARRADRRPPGSRRREGRPGPAHVLGPAHGLAPAVAAPRLGRDRLLDAEPPLADRLPRGGGHGLRHDARQAADRDRRLRRRDVRVPAARDRARLRDAGRSHGDPVGRPASRARGVARRSFATRCWPTRR